MFSSIQLTRFDTVVVWTVLTLSAGVLAGCGDTKLLKMTAQSTSGTSLTPGATNEGFRAMPPAELTMVLQQDSQLLITFTATGSVSNGPVDPSLQIRCEIDGRSCSGELPEQGVAFLYHYPPRESASCCPQDSQQWLTPRVSKGFHHVSILGRGNGDRAAAPSIGEWSLIVESIIH